MKAKNMIWFSAGLLTGGVCASCMALSSVMRFPHMRAALAAVISDKLAEMIYGPTHENENA